MARSGDRSRLPRSYSARSSSSKSSGNFRGRRHGVARSGRKTTGGRRSSCNATRTLCWKIDSAPAYRQEAAPVFSLLRQRHHGRRRQGVRGSAERQTSAARSHCVAGVGFHSHHVSVSAQSENQRAPAMGLVVPDRTARSAIVDLAFVLKCFGHLDEIVLLSTCNRVEIYGTIRQPTGHIKSLLQLLCAEPGDLDPHIYLHEGIAAVRHLLRVAAGLDSMVLGETEITGQIKNAYEIARNAGLTGRVLNRLFQRAFQVTKEIRTRTGIGRGTVSIKSTAVELIGKTDLSQQSIMVLGAGEMAENCIRLLVKKGAQSIFILNRSFDRALDLATRCGGEAVCFGYCLFEMCDVDVVIAATSSAETLLSCEDIG